MKNERKKKTFYSEMDDMELAIPSIVTCHCEMVRECEAQL